MFDKINQMFNFSQQVLNLYAKRQEILSTNIANADTPGYKSVDIDFKDEMSKILNKKKEKHASIFLKKTSPRHLNAKYEDSFFLRTIPVITNQIKQDGNTVNMDRERIEFINNSLKYQSSLAFMKNEIKNMMYVLKG
ncbi:flagellar basal-body rod protein FlgB [Buchnera aphidicola str. Ak (Acyrthosiphon kondoi)]|uniref:Flagellar basal body rod protein FlgB n=1 Tax=Buchnera aphidicola str. Ak (Acyrthosiphon kondoi) TaxID=1005090 RepID=G2LN47_9GAMM|nr:flagellar basal body rod protein FlgB [Buchnera aphidicola]AEO08685.1 flagellar basal-body rod protein FlgB [Buchnera aphidicola str. Ak (Acyrthosiphon kondoi)]